MWSRTARTAVAGLCLGAIVACNPDDGPQTGSESHFLVYCDGACEAGLSCICGTCTTPCVSDGECSHLSANAECIPVADRPEEASCLCPGVEAFCDVRCTRDADCAVLSPQHSCQRGFCRAPEFSGIGADQRVELSEVCQFYVEDMCRAKRECYGWDYRDQSHCEQASECWGEAFVLERVGDGRMTYDAEATYACHRRMLEDPCMFGLIISSPTLELALDWCESAAGTQPVGSPCESDVECAPGHQCHTVDACPGACRLLGQLGDACGTDLPSCDWDQQLSCHDDVCRPHVWEVGEPCDDSSDCGGNVIVLSGTYARLWCDTALGQCTRLALEGEACTPGSTADAPRCDTGLRCVAPSTLELGTCAPAGVDGESCLSDRDCAGERVCIPEDPAAGTEPKVCALVSAAGGACEFDSHCAEGLYCDLATHVCLALPNLGEACTDQCQDGLECAGSVCEQLGYPGDACDTEIDRCTYSRCVAGVCQLEQPMGTPCTEAAECLSGACDVVCVDPTGCRY